MKVCIIDFETGGTVPDQSIILNAAALVIDIDEQTKPIFNELLTKTMYCKFDINNQLNNGRTFEKSTLDWWKSTNPKLLKEYITKSNTDVTFSEFVNKFESYLCENGCKKSDLLMMSRGVDFDLGFLKYIYKSTIPQDEDVYMRLPYHFYKVCDSRSFYKGATFDFSLTRFPVDKTELVDFIPHNPIHDVCCEAMQFITCLRVISGLESITNNPHHLTINN